MRAGLVVGSVTTSEYLVLYMFFSFLVQREIQNFIRTDTVGRGASLVGLVPGQKSEQPRGFCDELQIGVDPCTQWSWPQHIAGSDRAFCGR